MLHRASDSRSSYTVVLKGVAKSLFSLSAAVFKRHPRHIGRLERAEPTRATWRGTFPNRQVMSLDDKLGFDTFGIRVWVSNLGFGLRASGFGLRVSGFRIRASGFGSGGSSFGLRASGFGLRASSFGFRAQKPKS